MFDLFRRGVAKVKEFGASFSDLTDFDKQAAGQYFRLSEQIATLCKKYSSEERGSQLVKRIVRYKQAHVLGGGVTVTVAKGKQADAETLLIDRFLDRRGFNEGLHKTLVATSELEGAVLVRIAEGVVDDAGTEAFCPSLAIYPFSVASYELQSDGNDSSTPSAIKKLSFTNDAGNQIDLSGESFDGSTPNKSGNAGRYRWAYLRLNGKAGTLAGSPTMAGVLTELEEVDLNLRDWRRMNRNCASSIPTWKCESKEEVDRIKAELAESGFGYGKSYIGTAEFKLSQGDAGDYQSLENELMRKAGIISAAVEIPLQDLGFPDMLSNRSTAESMDDSQGVSIDADAASWLGFYESIFRAVIEIGNESKNGPASPLDPESVKPNAVGVRKQDFNRVADVWLPLRKAGCLSRKTLLTFCPMINAEEELKQIEEEEAEDQKRAATPFSIEGGSYDEENGKDPKSGDMR